MNSCTIPNVFCASNIFVKLLFVQILPLMLQHCFKVLGFLATCISSSLVSGKKFLFMAIMRIKQTFPYQCAKH